MMVYSCITEPVLWVTGDWMILNSLFYLRKDRIAAL
jgi:hypothetical protein